MKSTALFITCILFTLFAQSQRYVDGAGACSGNSPCYVTIQTAVNAASVGETINVYPGTYNELVSIQKPLLLQSTSGKDVTTIQYTAPVGYRAPIMIEADAGSYSGITVGGSVNHGFTVIGADVTNDVAGGGVEAAAILIGSGSGNSISGINISYNTITANGDQALLTYYKSGVLYDNITVANNLFNGKTYVGQPQAGGNFAHGNVARQLIVVNQGTGSFTFRNNMVTGTSGEMVGSTAIANMVMTIDATTSSFTENYFMPTFAGTSNSILRVSGSAAISCNYFSMANANNATYYIQPRSFTSPPYTVATVAANNTFVGPGGVINSFFSRIQTSATGPWTANRTDPAPSCNAIALPVNFDEVTASISGNNLQVNWATLQEAHNDYFEIEASKDGRTFTSIGKVDTRAVNGNSSERIRYSFSGTLSGNAVMSISLLGLAFGLLYKRRKLHWLYVAGGLCGMLVLGIGCNAKQDSIDVIDGKLYVRIAQVDKDGNRSYSKVVVTMIN